MTCAEIDLISKAGRAKLDLLHQQPLCYFIRAMVAGGFLMTGTLLSVISGALFYESSFGVSKLLGAFTFSAALILIVLIGGELFTGTNFVLAVTLYERRARLPETLRLWLVCYLGNLAGIVFLALITAVSGASGTLMATYLAATIPPKLDCSVVQLVCKGMMCNFMVCTGVFAGMKLKSEVGKCIAITAVITTFILAGFEHCVANMATFSLYLMLVPAPDLPGCLYNLAWVTLGNILGGSILLGLPVWGSTLSSDAR